MEDEKEPNAEILERIEAEREKQAKLRWQIYAARLDPTKMDPPEPGYGLDGYPLQKPHPRAVSTPKEKT